VCKARSTTPDVFGIGHARLGHSAFGATLADGKLSLDSTWTNSTHLDSALTKLTVERQREADRCELRHAMDCLAAKPADASDRSSRYDRSGFLPEHHGTVCRVKHARSGRLTARGSTWGSKLRKWRVHDFHD